MTEFEDNAVVTAEDLNNIAVDLGDTTFSAFSDEKFGVDKLNEITADIVGKGVLFIDDHCKPKIINGTLYIQKGVIVFESGAKIRITEPLEVPSEVSVYIYAYNDTVTGKASIQTSSEYPSSGDFVMLARLNADGTVTDLRQMSVAKILLNTVPSVQTFAGDETLIGVFSGVYSGKIQLATDRLFHLTRFQFDFSSFRYDNHFSMSCFCDFTKLKEYPISVRIGGDYGYDVRLAFSLDENFLVWKAQNIGGATGKEYPISFEIDMI